MNPEGFSPEEKQMVKPFSAEQGEAGLEAQINTEAQVAQETVETIMKGIPEVQPEKLTPGIKDKLINKGLMLSEILLAAGGMVTLTAAAAELFMNGVPGNTVYDNPAMFWTVFSAFMAEAAAGIMDVTRMSLKNKFS